VYRNSRAGLLPLNNEPGYFLNKKELIDERLKTRRVIFQIPGFVLIGMNLKIFGEKKLNGKG
jgi:hypothetical protein